MNKISYTIGSPPDIDLDFADRDRKKIFEYIAEKYGNDKVSQIGTYSVFKPRGSLRDFARVRGHDMAIQSELANLIPPDVAGKSLTFDEAIKAEPKLLNTRYPEVVELARAAEGIMTKAGVHAAGALISDKPITDYVPLYLGKGKEVATQFDMHDVEDIGLVKFDFLGLSNLTVIQDTINLVKRLKNIDINIETIDREDQKVFKNIFQQGDLDGVFQFENSSGFKDLCVKIKPTCIEDLAVVTSLFRPGPLCLSGDTVIYTSYHNRKDTRINGKAFCSRKLKDMYNLFVTKTKAGKQRSLWLLSKDETSGKLTKRNKIKKIYKSGIKPVYQIKTRFLGSLYRVPLLKGVITKTQDLRASLDHKFLTLTGWKPLREIQPGEYLCTLRKMIGNTKPRSDCKTISGRKNFRDRAFYHYQYRCVFCNWDKGTLDVNHIYGNRNTNNGPENLCYLCPNHHRMYSEGTISPEEVIKAREKYRLPITEDFRWIRYEGKELIGEEETYDIELEGPNHNFIANEFVVHNSAGLLNDYVKRRNGEPFEYLTPELEPILKDTYGIVVFQESIMRICIDLAGYTASEADIMRAIIGKKKTQEMPKQREKFIRGCVKNNINRKIATELINAIEGWSLYGFNRSHGCAYSLVSYQTAWLKYYFPEEFYTSLFNNTLTEQPQLVKYIYSCREQNISIMPPDVNKSEALFKPENGTIIFGLAGLKGIGEKACIDFLEKRPLKGFSSLEELTKSNIHQKTLKVLAECGALESICTYDRGQIIEALPLLISTCKKIKLWDERKERFEQRERQRKEMILAGKKPIRKLPKLPRRPVTPIIKEEEPLTKDRRLALEKETLGFYITGHPLDSYPRLMETFQNTIEILTQSEFGQEVSLPVVIYSIEKRRTKAGKNMANMIVEDRTGRMEATIFPYLWKNLSKEAIENSVVILSGKTEIQIREGLPAIVRLIVKNIKRAGKEIELRNIKLRLKDGTTLKFLPSENIERNILQRALALVNNLGELHEYVD